MDILTDAAPADAAETSEPPAPSISSHAFFRAHAVYIDTLMELTRQEAAILTPANRAHDRGEITLEEVTAAEDAIAPACTANWDAAKKLALMSAPDRSALLTKLDVIRRDRLFDDSAIEAIFGVLHADIVRLIGEA